VPDELMASIVERTLTVGAGQHGFLLDGYPRTLEQAHFLSKAADIDAVISITMREDHIVQKLLGRRACSECGQSYNIAHIDEDGIYMPALLPKNSSCTSGGICTELISRDDDTEAVIRNRLRVHNELTMPVIDYYERQHLEDDPNKNVAVMPLHIEGGYALMTPRFFDALGIEGPGAGL
jgi:adenylate kinase